MATIFTTSLGEEVFGLFQVAARSGLLPEFVQIVGRARGRLLRFAKGCGALLQGHAKSIVTLAELRVGAQQGFEGLDGCGKVSALLEGLGEQILRIDVIGLPLHRESEMHEGSLGITPLPKSNA